jgi:uncharacterized repeat protein (TIGR04138 family)
MSAYPVDAFVFVQQGLAWTVKARHGQRPAGECRHVTGRELAEGLREVATHKWGRLARTVLERWHITATLDFGRIVFALIEAGLLAKSDEDALDDFRDVYDFGEAFESRYRIEPTLVLP